MTHKSRSQWMTQRLVPTSILTKIDDFNVGREQITQNNGDLALAEYARVGRAVNLYEVGDRAEAILEMEDMSLILKGYPGEV